jgi:hypothetical protein
VPGQFLPLATGRFLVSHLVYVARGHPQGGHEKVATRRQAHTGASHMNTAFPKSFCDHMGLVSFVDTHRRFQSSS